MKTKRGQLRLSPELRRFQAAGIAPGKAKRLIKAFGSVERVLAADVDALDRVHGIGYWTAKQVSKIGGTLAERTMTGDPQRDALKLLKQHRLNHAAIARMTGLRYADVRKLAEPIRQQWRAEQEKRQAEWKRRNEEQLRQPQPVHVVCRCGRFMEVTQQSVTVEVKQDGSPENPDRLWAADLYTCPECGQEVLSGFGQRPIAEQGHPSYLQQRVRLAPVYPARVARPEVPQTPKLYAVSRHDEPEAV